MLSGQHAKLLNLTGALTLVSLGIVILACSALKNHERLNELRDLAASTPLFPGFQLVNSHEGGKRENAIIARFYRSNATYDQVKDFYRRTLIEKGWGEPIEESLSTWGIANGGKVITFHKGEYSIEVEYSAESQTWNFSVSYVWEAK
jgi:hypothetical protein